MCNITVTTIGKQLVYSKRRVQLSKLLGLFVIVAAPGNLLTLIPRTREFDGVRAIPPGATGLKRGVLPLYGFARRSAQSCHELALNAGAGPVVKEGFVIGGKRSPRVRKCAIPKG